MLRRLPFRVNAGKANARVFKCYLTITFFTVLFTFTM